ncbi:MAG: PaaI family thioesterase [Pseudomonadota bacterium]
MSEHQQDTEQLNAYSEGFLPGHLGIRFLEAVHGLAIAELPVHKHLMAPNGFLHAGSVVTLADTACGYGCVRALPKGAMGFTTIELKSNFLGTTQDGVIECRAEATHLGRMTQLWDATVKHRETDKTIALFRCTQMVLWPKE